MDDEKRGCVRAGGLPVTMAQYLYLRLDPNQACFRWRQLVATGPEVACNGLRVSSKKRRAWTERFSKMVLRLTGRVGAGRA